MLNMGFLIGVLSALTAASADVTAAQACPTEVPNTRVLVERFLTRAAHEPSRQETGLTGTLPSSIRLLQSETDDAVCARLNTAIGSSSGQSGPWRWTYYTAGGRYVVAMQYVSPPGERRVGFVPIFVYDASMRLLGTYAM
jgi:hypothetical protein